MTHSPKRDAHFRYPDEAGAYLNTEAVETITKWVSQAK